MNTTNSLICLQTIIFGKCLGIKVIAWASRLEPRNFFMTFGLFKGLILNVLRSINMRLIDSIHATSHKAKEALILEGHQCPIFVAPTHGIPSHFISNSKINKKINNSVLNVGYVGDLLDFKGVDILIEAMSILPLNKTKLHIAGIGPEKKMLKELALSKNIDAEFKDYIDNLAMPEFYSGCDVVVLPSKGDGLIIEKFGRVLIEAAASGCAVVGSNVGGIPLAVGEQGLLFQDRSIDHLASILERMLDIETLNKEKIRCHQFAIKNFSMEIVASKFFNSLTNKLI